MMKRKLLLTMLFIVGLLGMNAQTLTSSEVGKGYALLYNVGMNQYLTRGNGWGTQASIGGAGSAMTVVLEKVEENYKIRVLNSYGLECLGDGTVYTDQSRNKTSTWTFKEVDATNHIYNIISADNHGGGSGKFLTAEGGSSTKVVPGNDGTIDNAKWKIILHADRPAALLEAMKNATEEAPVDVTCFIKDANFGAYSDIAFQCWTVTASNRNLNGGKLTNPCAETYMNGGGKIYQTISVPNGTYKVKCQGFYDPRDGGNTPSILYANDETPVGLKKWASSNASMDGASDVFTNGEYENEIQVVVTTKSLTIGIEGTDGNWTCFDNFRLSYLGPLDLSTYVQGLSDALDAAKAIDPSAPMNKDVAAALAKAISDYDGKSFDNSDDYDAAIMAVTTATNNATTSIDNYEFAKMSITLADGYDEPGKASFAADETVAAIKAAYDNGTLTEVTEEQVAAITAAFIAACKAQVQPADGCNMTAYIVNPRIDGNADGWTTEKKGNTAGTGGPMKPSNDAMEYWGGDSFLSEADTKGFDYYQEITGLPNGLYAIRVDLYHSTNGEKGATWDPEGSAGVYGKTTYAEVVSLVTVDGTTPTTYTTAPFIVDDGNLRLGVKNIRPMAARWFVADDFRLYYVRKLIASDYADALAEAVDRAGKLNGQIPTAAYSELQATVTSYNKSYDTIDEYKNAINAIDAATEAKNSLLAPYATWKQQKAAADAIVAATGNTKLEQKFTAFSAGVEATTTVEDLSDLVTLAQDLLNAYNGWMALKGKADILKAVANDNADANTAFKNAITAQTGAAVSALDEANPVQAIAKVKAATAALKAAMTTYVGAANPVGEGAQFDCTFMLTNPDLTGLPIWQKADGWGTEQTGGNSQVMTNGNATSEDGTKTAFFEYWNNPPTQENVFALYLKNVTLPVGTYDMFCYAFAQNEQGGKHDNIPNGVYFYANDTQGSAVNTARLSAQSIKFINTSEQKVKIGLKPVEGNGNTWMGIGYVELYKVPTDNTPHDIIIEVANAEAEATVNKVVVTATPVFSHVVLTITPNEGYYVESVTAEDADNNEVKVTSHPADGNYTFTMPAKDVNVSVVTKELAKATMTITAAKYATFIAPFAVAVPAGVTASTVNGTDADGYTLTLTPVEGNVIPANTPVMLYSEAPVNETFSGIPVGTEDSYTVGWLTGVYAETLAPVGSYVMQNQGGHVAFYCVPEGFTKKVPANRAYLTEASSGINVFYFPGEEGGVTAIEGFDALTSGDFDAIYTASGVKVDALQKGLNIVVKGDKSYKIYVK